MSNPKNSGGVSVGVWTGIIWNASKILASALLMPFVARLMGAEGYGQYAYYLALIFLASALARLGVPYTLTKYLAERPADPAWRHGLIRYGAWVQSLGGLIAVVGLLAFLGARADATTGLAALAVVAALVGDQAAYFGRGVLYGLRREAAANNAAALGAVLAPALGLALAAAGLGVVGVVAGLAVANLIMAALTLRAAVVGAGPAPASGASPLPVRALIKFGLSASLFSILHLALYRADAVLIRHLSTDAQAGVYAAAVQWVEFVWFVGIAVESVMLQASVRLWLDNQLAAITALVGRFLRLVALGTTLMLVVVLGLADHILSLYFGPGFEGAALTLRLMAPGVFGFALARVMWPVVQARGQAGPLLGAMGAGLAANLLLNLWLTPQWGALGAAAATSLAYAGVGVAYLLILRAWGVRLFSVSHSLRLGAVAAAALTVIGLIAAALQPAWLAILVGGGGGTAVFGAGAVLLGLVEAQDVEAVLARLPAAWRPAGLRLITALKPFLPQRQALPEA